MNIFYIIIYILLSVITCVYIWLRKRYSYWAVRGVIHDKPLLIYGNLYNFRRTQTFHQVIRDYYLRYRRQGTFAGFYLFLRPAILLLDFDLIKRVLIKDFANFTNRGVHYNEKDDPLSAHLFNVENPKWRALRSKLTPTFTSGKMRFMLPVVVQVAEQFVQELGEILENKKLDGSKSIIDSEGIEVKHLLECYSIDVIGNCAFGLECNSLRDPNTQFRLMGKKAFIRNIWVFPFMQAFPSLARKLGMKTLLPDVNDFFMRIVRETVEYRERENILRNDYMNLLIELKQKNGLEDLTLEEIAAQAFIFFAAGFETSSSAMSFSLYELALNPEVQERARTEIIEALERHNGVLNDVCLRELKYLLQILQETLRLYSTFPVIRRIALKDYPVPNSNHIIESGTPVLIPINGIHHDPDIYPDPERFDPERFTPEAIEKRNSFAWLPFGEGPRNCIGERFGEMQVLVGLAMLLKNFRFSPSSRTQIPPEYDVENVLLQPRGGIFLNIEKI